MQVDNEDHTGITVLRDRCSHEMIEMGLCSIGSDLVEQRVTLPTQNPADQMLLSTSGRWLVVRRGQQLFSYDMEAGPSEHPEEARYKAKQGPGDVDTLVGALRSGDWVIYRRGQQLIAYNIETDEGLPLGKPDDNLLAVALGDRHVVARYIDDSGGEQLYLLTVDPYRKEDSTARGPKILLADDPHGFSRVVITRGSVPKGETVPTDHRILVSSGDPVGDTKHWETRIFDAHTGLLEDSFSGLIVTHANPLLVTEGLSATTPDGKAVAYITQARSLALRELGDAASGSCLVRSHHSGVHNLAGFAADGEFFFESDEKNEDNESHSRIYSFSFDTLKYSALSPLTSSYYLKAVPHAAHPAYIESEAPTKVAWAIAMSGSLPRAVQGNAARSVDAGDASYLPRQMSSAANADQSLWLLEAKLDSIEHLVTLGLRRMTPSVQDGHLTVAPGEAPTTCGDEKDECDSDTPTQISRFELVYPENSKICMSTAGIEGWARDCVVPMKNDKVMGPKLPMSERAPKGTL